MGLKPAFGSLFSGIGGIDLGLERAGWECKWQVEKDPFCQRVLAKHWPQVARYGDVKDVDGSRLEKVDLIAGGFPCQPVSMAGKRKGKEDDRWLWPDFARIIGVLRPRFVFVENVPGITSLGLDQVLGDLATLRYDAEWDCVPASAFGAPHRRYRILLVAHNTDRIRLEDSEITRLQKRQTADASRSSAMANTDPGGLGRQDPSHEVDHAAFQTDKSAFDEPGSNGPFLADTHDGRLTRTRLHAGSEQEAATVTVRFGETVSDSESSGLEGIGQESSPGRTGFADSGQILANASSQESRRRERSNVAQTMARGQSLDSAFGTGSQDVADAQRIIGWSRFGGRSWPLGNDGVIRSGRALDTFRAVADEWRQWWAAEPDVGRVADGIPARVDRLRGLGNAVVPQVAEWIGRCLINALQS